MSKEIAVYDGPKVVRVYTEKQSDGNGTFEEKAAAFAEKNGFTLKPGKESEIVEPSADDGSEAVAEGVESVEPVKKGRGKSKK